jgi:hypothetical protein
MNEFVDGGWMMEESFNQFDGKEIVGILKISCLCTICLYFKIRFPCGTVNHGKPRNYSIHSVSLINVLSADICQPMSVKHGTVWSGFYVVKLTRQVRRCREYSRMTPQLALRFHFEKLSEEEWQDYAT